MSPNRTVSNAYHSQLQLNNQSPRPYLIILVIAVIGTHTYALDQVLTIYKPKSAFIPLVCRVFISSASSQCCFFFHFLAILHNSLAIFNI
jgi:hypothetical protein